MDNGGQYNVVECNNFCNKTRIKSCFTLNKYCCGIDKSIIFGNNQMHCCSWEHSQTYLGKSYEHCVHLAKQKIIKGHGTKKPLEVFNAKKFDIANLKVFGAKIHIHISKIKGEVNQRKKSLPPPHVNPLQPNIRPLMYQQI